MTQNEKIQIRRRNAFRNLWQKLSGTPDFSVKLALAALYLVGAVYVCVRQVAWRTLAGNIPLLSPLLKAAMEHALLAYLLAGAAVLLVLLLYPFGRRAAKDQLQCIGLINHAGMPPDLLRKHRDKDNPRVTVWEFRNQGIPLQEWEKKRPAIETALGLIIVKLAYAKGKKPSTGLRCPCGGRFAGSSKVGGQLPIVKEFCAGAGRKLYRPCDSQPRPHPPHSVGRVYRQRQKAFCSSCCLCRHFTRTQRSTLPTSKAAWTTRKSGTKNAGCASQRKICSTP